MKKIMPTVSMLLLVFLSSPGSGYRIIHKTGVGTRAYSMANNYVAVAQDLSALYWNPAGLAFLPVREFQISLFGQSQKSRSSLFGTEEIDHLQRLHLMQGGLVYAFPTSRGGFSLAGSYQNPVVFDDISTFSGTYGDTTVSSTYRTFGGLNFWSGGFGLQVAPGMGIGATMSIITGREQTRDTYSKTASGSGEQFDDNIETGYLGYDLRAGLLYSYRDKAFWGARLVFPRRIRFREEFSEDFPDTAGRLYSSYEAALGYAMELPYFTFSTEVHIRLPYTVVFPSEKILSKSGASSAKAGGGVGFEAPLFVNSTLVRAGYAYEEFDRYSFVAKYADQPFDEAWAPDGVDASQERHLVTTGFAWLVAQWNFEIGYGYQFWEVETNNTLTERYGFHRFLVSFSMRF
ncbi:MAG: hypothetical protein GF350_17550 [Chitinivibrionales bacterium]|nr:hypothetical protein [Chitinivibrionales bacterium]